MKKLNRNSTVKIQANKGSRHNRLPFGGTVDVGKKVVVTDGLAVKSTMPVFDDVEVVDEGYDIRLELTFNEDLELVEVTEIKTQESMKCPPLYTL